MNKVLVSEGDYWHAIWKLVATTLCFLVLISASCSAYRVTIVSDAIRDGNDPIATACAFEVPLARENVPNFELCKKALEQSKK
jgi:hypothetical protein